MDPEPVQEFLTQFLLCNAPPYVLALCWAGRGRRPLTAVFYPLLFIGLSVVGAVLLACILACLPTGWQLQQYAFGWVVLCLPFVLAHGLLCAAVWLIPPAPGHEMHREATP